MKQIKKLVLVTTVASLGSIYGMEKEQSLPSKAKQETASEAEYTFLKQIKTGKGVHSDLFAAALSPNGKTIILANWQTGVRDNAQLWDINSGRLLKEFKHPNNVTSVAFSPNGKTILTGSNDGIARLWDVETGNQLKEFKGHKWNISSVAFSPNGETVLTGSWDTTARLWDVKTGKQLKEFKHPKDVFSVAYSPNGKIVATGSLDQIARLWNVETGELLNQTTEFRIISLERKESEGHTGAITSVAFSPDGKTLLTGSIDETAQLWDVKSGNYIKGFMKGGRVSSVAFSPYGTEVLIGSSDKKARLWDIETGKEIQEFTKHTGGVTSVAFSKDGEVMITGADDTLVNVYNRS